MFKIHFESEAMGAGVPVDNCWTDNGLSTSKEFIRDIHIKSQGIRYSVVGGQHHNGLVENKIKIVVIISRNIMIHDALRWNETS